MARSRRGSATDGSRIYAAISDLQHSPYTITSASGQASTVTGGSWSALDAATAKIIWQTADPHRGYPATTLEAIADAADTSLPTLYRLFASKPALLKAVLDVSFGGDDEPVAFGDRPEVQEARAESDPVALIRAFARIGREFMERSSAIMHVLATAAQVDPDAGQLMEEIRRQRLARRRPRPAVSSPVMALRNC